jgi:hypothetical protein
MPEGRIQQKFTPYCFYRFLFRRETYSYTRALGNLIPRSLRKRGLHLDALFYGLLCH